MGKTLFFSWKDFCVRLLSAINAGIYVWSDNLLQSKEYITNKIKREKEIKKGK